MIPFRFSSLLLSALVALPLAAQAHPRYTVTIVGAPGSTATGINKSGAVIGNFSFAATVTHGFVNKAGVITDLGTLPDGLQSFARGINDSGVIVGEATNADGYTRAFRYEAGAMADLGTLGGDTSRAAAINNRGDIVGAAEIPLDEFVQMRAFLLRPGVAMQDLGRIEVPNPEGSSHAYDVNDSRKVVGGSVVGPFDPPESPFHAFLYACEEMKDLGTLGGQYSVASAINNKGVVVGEASTPDFHFNRAFLYHHGVMKNLGTLPGGEFSRANDINDKGQVVGMSQGVGGNLGFLWQSGSMRSLNSLVGAASGWNITEGMGINYGGQIAANGCKAGVCYAVRLDPRH